MKCPALLLLIAMNLPTAAPAQSPPAPTPACEAPEHRQFDFWIGEWDVTTPDGKLAGRNVITRVAGGCALHENWAGRGGFSGQSLNGWHAATRRWTQTWLDSSGGRLQLSGGLQGSSMVLEGEEADAGPPARTLRHRIRWTPLPDGAVRQLWEQSQDDGRSWSTAFDGRYVKRP